MKIMIRLPLIYAHDNLLYIFYFLFLTEEQFLTVERLKNVQIYKYIFFNITFYNAKFEGKLKNLLQGR